MGAPAIDPPGQWAVLAEYGTSRVVARGPVVCVHFWGPMTPAELHAEFDAQERVLETSGHLVQVVVFEASKLRRIGFDAQSVAAERIKRWGPRLLRAALVLEGEGLGASLLRVALMTVMALSRQRESHRLFSTLDEGLRWVCDAPGLDPAARDASARELTERFGIPPR